MTSIRSPLLELSLAVLLGGGTALASAPMGPPTVAGQPRWTPTQGGSGGARPVGAVTTSARNQPGWPYYTDVPSSNPAGWPASSAAVNAMPTTPWTNAGGTIAFPTTVPMPIASMPSTTWALPTMPTSWTGTAPNAGMSNMMPTWTGSSSVASTPTVAGSAAVDGRTLQTALSSKIAFDAGQRWQEYDIQPYTASFHASARPEESIREWILRATGESAWQGLDPTSLVVTPQRVKVFNTPQVQTQVADVLGRMLNYLPGEIDCRVHIWNVHDLKWRNEFLDRLQSLPTSDPSRQVWSISGSEAARITQWMSPAKRSATLASPRFLAANGQPAKVRWADDASYQKGIALDASSGGSMNLDYRSRTALAEDGVLVIVNPLMASANAVDVELQVQYRKMVQKQSLSLTLPGRPKIDVPEVPSALVTSSGRLAVGNHLLVSMGMVPSFADRPGLHWRSDRTSELLVLIELQPTAANRIQTGLASR